MKKRERKKEWFDSERYWRATFPFMFPEKTFGGAAETVRKALMLARVEGKSALDLCCGPGRCSIALAEQGFTVTGVDRTKYLLEKARERARTAGARIEWIAQDMRDFVRPDAFDFALSVYTSFGYFEDRNEDARVLANVFASLRPGGAFLLDVMGREVLAKSFLPSSADTFPDGSTLVEQRQILDDWTRIRSKWTIIRNGKTQSFTLQLNLYSGQELREKMQHAGFVDIQLYGSIDGIPYGPDAKRLVAVGRKPKQATPRR
jgi:SAM-dependent methyltransferase